MTEIKDLTDEQLVKKIILNSIKVTKLGMVTITSNDVLAFDSHHPYIKFAKELNETKNELLRRLKGVKK